MLIFLYTILKHRNQKSVKITAVLENILHCQVSKVSLVQIKFLCVHVTGKVQ